MPSVPVLATLVTHPHQEQAEAAVSAFHGKRLVLRGGEADASAWSVHEIPAGEAVEPGVGEGNLRVEQAWLPACSEEVRLAKRQAKAAQIKKEKEDPERQRQRQSDAQEIRAERIRKARARAALSRRTRTCDAAERRCGSG